jgi:hypothetical protein
MRLVTWEENDRAGHICQMLSPKLKNTNTTGVKGVSHCKRNNNYEAALSYKGKKYRKTFKNFEEAVEYRKQLEEMIVGVMENSV